MGLIGSALKFTGKLVIGMAGEIIKNAAGAAKVQQNAKNLSNRELVDAYKNSTSTKDRVGYAAEIKDRAGK